MKLNHLTIGQRLGFLATILLLATLFIGIRGLAINAGGLVQNQRIMTTEKVVAQSIDTARNAQVQFKIQVQEWKNTLLRGTQGQQSFDKYKNAFVEQSQKTQALLKTLRELLPQIGLPATEVTNTINLHAELEQHYLSALQQYAIQDATSAQRVDHLVTGIDREPTRMIDEVVASTLKQAALIREQTEASNYQHFSQTRLMLLLVMALTLVVGLLITWWLIRSITQPLAQAVSVARNVASGDLQSTIIPAGRDETAELMHALLEMNGNLTRIVTGVRSGTETIAGASQQIASGSRELSSRNEAQASALEQTAASMEELTAVVKNNAENSRIASDITREATQVANQGGEVVERVVQTMSEINQLSTEISSIIGVIDSIAFQTNILALNAAVEAARAGTEGRGFAVVASEVRALAQRSATAAKEISALIQRSVTRIDEGNQLVKSAGSAMDDIMQSVAHVSKLVETISLASNDQSVGIDQVHVAITRMDAATQQNATLSQESSAAAHAMQQQAENLLEMVQIFKLRTNNKMV
ncbi:methyl-accepting chemotaxis protein [Kosakonia radicincitans DSM 16656]|uniref:methyl-accepting chemotaxis protein n=1 Tax=Kosakonia TaxID=1330547 RepID=UPI000273015C|nr:MULTISPECIES: methyl-accepting chemotaxis protein [Kosakonia]ARD61263.1 methyl-accepting chemotaxis protein [Kosakonia radicincitans DSM 16656]KDE37151.1 chemotaxis protein [Kosakonia radicincitans UMEnt01/12]PTA92969.1 methyl-accepting chemotaxis protein [Kosakonia sp. H7A]